MTLDMTVQMLFLKGSLVDTMPRPDLRAHTGVDSHGKFYMLKNPSIVNSYAALVSLPALQQKLLLVKPILPPSYIHPVTLPTFVVNVVFSFVRTEQGNAIHTGATVRTRHLSLRTLFTVTLSLKAEYKLPPDFKKFYQTMDSLIL